MASNLACNVQRVKKLLVLPATLLLTSCTVMDVVGPRPNGEIMALAKQASADATGGDPDWRALRQTQSQQLHDEALRLCGVDPSGKTPGTVELIFAPGPVLKQWVATDEMGDRTTVILRNLRTGVELRPSAFSIPNEIERRKGGSSR